MKLRSNVRNDADKEVIRRKVDDQHVIKKAKRKKNHGKEVLKNHNKRVENEGKTKKSTSRSKPGTNTVEGDVRVHLSCLHVIIDSSFEKTSNVVDEVSQKSHENKSSQSSVCINNHLSVVEGNHLIKTTPCVIEDTSCSASDDENRKVEEILSKNEEEMCKTSHTVLDCIPDKFKRPVVCVEKLKSKKINNTSKEERNTLCHSLDSKRNSKIFKRCALVASTPLVGSLDSIEMPSNLQNNLSGSYWSAESQLSKISPRDDTTQRSSSRIQNATGNTPKVKISDSCAIRKLRYCHEDPTKLQYCHEDPTKLQYCHEDPTKKTKTPNAKRRTSINAKKNNISRRSSLSMKKIKGNPYRRGSLVKNYLSCASSFTILKSVKKKKAPKSCVPCNPEPDNKSKKTTAKYQSFATERFLMKQNSKALSKTFTAINNKNISKLQNQSFALDKYLPNTSYLQNVSYLSNVSCRNLNKSEISLLNRKRKKKLYTHRKSDKFNKSPGMDEAESSMDVNPSNNSLADVERGKRVKTNVSSKTCFENIIEDSDKENSEEFSSIKVDDEISFRVKTNSFNAMNEEMKSELLRGENAKVAEEDNQDNDYLIHSRDKTKTSINTVNEKCNGSYIAPPNKDRNSPNKDGKAPNKANIVVKKKKKLHKKGFVVFDLEASMSEKEERNKTFHSNNMTCNQSIMASVLNFNQ